MTYLHCPALYLHNSDIFTQDWRHLGEAGEGGKSNWRKQPFHNWNTALPVSFFFSTLGREVEILNEKRDKGKSWRERDRYEHLGSAGDWGGSQLFSWPSLCQRENHGNDFAALQIWSWIHMPYNDSFASFSPNISLCLTVTQLLFPVLKHFFPLDNKVWRYVLLERAAAIIF